MCAIEGADEIVNLLTDEDRKARKAHKCSECHRVIQPGETYRYEVGTFDGQMVQYRTCSHCMVCRNWLQRECGGWLFEGVEEDLFEHAQEYGRSSLYRLTVGMRRKWQRFDKTGLMKVPEVTHA